MFEDAAARGDLAMVRALAKELKHRDKPRAVALKREIASFLDAHAKERSAALKDKSSTVDPDPGEQPSELASNPERPSPITLATIEMTQPHLLERLSGLLEYVKQTVQLKGKPHRQVEQHQQFRAYEHELLGLPGVHFDVGGSDDDIWLRMERLHETKPSPPTGTLLAGLIVQSNTPAKEPTLAIQVSRAQMTALGIGLPTPEEEADQNELFDVEDLDVHPKLLSELSTYIAHVWRPWASKEEERRKTIAKYAALFACYQMLQGNLADSQLELVMGIGLAVWDLPDGKLTYPLISKLVELTIDERTHAIEVRPRSLDPRLELDVYTALDNLATSEVAQFGKKHFALNDGGISPFLPSSFEPVLKAASSLLDSKGAYWPLHTSPGDRALPKPEEQLQVTDTWVLFARPRTSSLLVQDLERFEKLVESGIDLATLSPATLAILADPSDEITEPQPPSYRGLSSIDRQAGTAAKAKDLFFPMPYNDEQVQILHMLDQQDGVVVQGPPGTGKTHTIANVISHYLATGKRVLVTSMKDPALAVLQDKLPKEIRPLAISLLSSEAEGMKQFENSIRHIAGEISRISRTEMRAQVLRHEGHIDTLHAQIAKVEYAIAQWAQKNLEPISLDGEPLQPLEVAQEVADHSDEATWISDAITVSPDHAPRFKERDILDLRDARMTLGQDLALIGQRLPVLDAFPEASKLQQAHLDLSRLSDLNAEVSSATMPALSDLEQATIESAGASHARAAELLRVRDALAESGYDWLPAFEQRLRMSSPQEDLIKLLAELCVEIQGTLKDRTQFVTRPISIPAGMLAHQELEEAVSNQAAGRKPFGLAGLFGKSVEKKLLEQVQVVGMPPATAEDWRHIHSYLSFQKKCASIVVRWNALASELQLPALDTPDSVTGPGARYATALETLQRVLDEEKALVAQLSALLPSWADAAKAPSTREGLEKTLNVLDHNLTRHRLAATWQVKDSFTRALSEATGTISEGLREFLDNRVGKRGISESQIMEEWSALLIELRRQRDCLPLLARVTEVTEKVEASGAPIWAQTLRTVHAAPHHDAQLPDNWKSLWRWRRLLTLVESMDGRVQLARLSRQRSDLESELSKTYQQAVTTRTWLQMVEKATPAVRSALEAYRVAISRIGRGTGVRAPRFRKDARDAAEHASPAIPCWIMPHYRISESLPVALGEFDLVIIDEASQSDLTALPALLRAKKVLIVGDDQQVSPEGVGLEDKKITSLMGQFLGNQVDLYRPQMSPDKSIYDLFKVVFAQGQVMLREHFRCVGPIIEYSKREFYDHQLQPLRTPRASERMDPPLIDVHVIDGMRGNGKTNEGEARFILEEIRKIVGDPSMSRRSIGVVSLVGSEQAKLVWDKVSRELGEDAIERHDMAFGDARTFQGKERDIVFLSMVVSGRAQASSHPMFRQRFNVAASRARDRMYLVRSITADQLSAADKLRTGLLQHFQAPYVQNEEDVADLRQLCESPFEREVFDALVERGYRVQPQVKVGSYRIDLVVEGEQDARLAVECDGDRYHGPDHWEHDMRRQRVLERAGWRFWRCFASTFVSHRESVLTDLLDTLQGMGIRPIGPQTDVRSVYSQSRAYEAFPIEDSDLYDEDIATA